MKNISKRELFAFLLGLVSFFLLDSIINFEDSVAAFKKGFNETREVENPK